ncbi:hypothetical protein Tco_0312921 [Tanacetum coccineum]
MDILQNTNFFRAFTASAFVPSIYIQQFWNTLAYEAKTGDAIMNFVNELGYTKAIHFVSRMAVNNLYQSRRAILSMINQYLIGKTSRYDRPRYPVLQMLWGIITSTNVDFAELMWEEFVQVIQTFLIDKANLGSPTKKGRKDKPCVIPYCRFTKLIICHLGRIHNIHQRSTSPFHLTEEDFRLGNLKFVPKGEVDEVFGMLIPNELISNNIRNAPNYNAYLEMVAKHDQKVAAEKEGKKKTASTKQPKSKSATEKLSKPAPAAKPKPAKEKSSKPSTAKPPKPKPAKPIPLQNTGKGKVTKVHNVKSSFQLGHVQVGGVAFQEPVAEAIRPLPVVEGKGKAILTGEQASTRPFAQLQDDTFANIVRDSPSFANAETSAGSDKINSGGDTEVLRIIDELGEDVDEQVNLEEKTIELDQEQAALDPGETHKS